MNQRISASLPLRGKRSPNRWLRKLKPPSTVIRLTSRRLLPKTAVGVALEEGVVLEEEEVSVAMGDMAVAMDKIPMAMEVMVDMVVDMETPMEDTVEDMAVAMDKIPMAMEVMV